jgi:hypothetical protein
MTISNQPGAAALDTMTELELSQLPAGLLAAIQGEVDSDLAKAKRRRATLDAVLERRYGAVTLAARARLGKDSGTTRVPDGGCTVIADGQKTVNWDQEGLDDLKDLMVAAGDDPAVYIGSKVTLTVNETAYKGWPERVRKAFEPHRTITVKTKYRIEPAKESA